MTSLVIGWFSISMLTALLWNLGVFLHMRKRGIPIKYPFHGFLGYKEMRYVTWRRSQGLEVGVLPWMSAIVYINAIAASVVFVMKSP